MYAVISTGGKQYRVTEGQTIDVDRLGEPGSDVELRPVLLVDGETVLATPEDLGGVTVKASIVEDVKGPKITGFTYKNKSNQRRRWGHRQRQPSEELHCSSRPTVCARCLSWRCARSSR